jgi:hypothetical protein
MGEQWESNGRAMGEQWEVGSGPRPEIPSEKAQIAESDGRHRQQLVYPATEFLSF